MPVPRLWPKAAAVKGIQDSALFFILTLMISMAPWMSPLLRMPSIPVRPSEANATVSMTPRHSCVVFLGSDTSLHVFWHYETPPSLLCHVHISLAGLLSNCQAWNIAFSPPCQSIALSVFPRVGSQTSDERPYSTCCPSRCSPRQWADIWWGFAVRVGLQHDRAEPSKPVYNCWRS